MKQILLPTDLTFDINHLIDFAFRIIEKPGGRLVVLYTYKARGTAATLVSIEAHMKEDAKRSMQQLEKKIADRVPEGVRVETQITYGTAPPTIARIADEEAFDLILMSPGQSSILRDIFTGSVTKNVIQATKRPVLAIPQEAVHSGMARIVLAVDDQPLSDQEVLEPLRELARAQESKVLVFHVSKPDGSDVHESVKSALEGVNYELFVEEEGGDLNTRIDTFAEEQAAEMICMIYHERSLMQRIFSTSESLRKTGRATIPILILQERHSN